MSTVTSQVAATTITNIGGTSRKFYTIHVIGSRELRHWGRIGAIGDYQIIEHASKRAAEESAEKQLRKKERGGYSNRQNVLYALADKYIGYQGDQFFDIVRNAHLAAQEGEWRNVSDPRGIDNPMDVSEGDEAIATAFDSFNERALSVVGSAASGSPEAAKTYAALREEFDGYEEGYERCKSLLETLEVMLTSGAPA